MEMLEDSWIGKGALIRKTNGMMRFGQILSNNASTMSFSLEELPYRDNIDEIKWSDVENIEEIEKDEWKCSTCGTMSCQECGNGGLEEGDQEGIGFCDRCNKEVKLRQCGCLL